MGLQIEVEAVQAAFYREGDEDDYSPGTELARILRALADRIDGEALDDQEEATYVLRDANGNKVGTADWESDLVDEDDEDDDQEEEDDDDDEDEDDE